MNNTECQTKCLHSLLFIFCKKKTSNQSTIPNESGEFLGKSMKCFNNKTAIERKIANAKYEKKKIFFLTESLICANCSFIRVMIVYFINLSQK